MRSGGECRFGYRTSIFKELGGREIVTAAALTLARGAPEAIRAAMNERVAFRKLKHPLEYPNAGSVFKNVPFASVPDARRSALEKVVKTDPFPVVPAAYLISEAGLKGARHGGAEISAKHPNFIINTGGATCADIEALITRVKETVRTAFDIELEEEIVRI